MEAENFCLLREVQTCRLQGLPPLEVQASDVAHWQRHQQRVGAWDVHMQYWKQQLSEAPDALDLPADTARPKTRTGQGHYQPLVLDATITKQLRAVASEHGVSVLVIAIAAFQVGFQHDLCTLNRASEMRQECYMLESSSKGFNVPGSSHAPGRRVTLPQDRIDCSA